MNNKIEELSVSTIRSLCIDEINKAKSGHPGMALGSAPILYTLFSKHLVSNPHVPNWFNRDRFVLSAGHTSALLYTMLHLCDYGLPMEEIQKFRQLGSLTPGHPEYGWTRGVDATSGPLGQGIAQAVGMAMAEQFVQASYPDGKDLVNHYTYVLCGDGCLQEGLSQEAISLAGHQKLNKLILIYDSNSVTLDGGLDLSFSESVKTRFLASEWNVLEVEDGNDISSIDEAIAEAKKFSEKPTLIIVKTIIGYGSAKQGTNKVHGAPLGEEDGKRAKVEVYGFDHADFYVPEEVYAHLKETFVARGEKAYSDYLKATEAYQAKYPEQYAQFMDLQENNFDKFISNEYPELIDGSSVSTRVASGKALNVQMKSIPTLVGGSADVAGSVMTKLDNGMNFSASCRGGHNINFGIREFAMASAQNGMLLHGGVRTYVGSFFVFSDYMKSAIRMSALSNLPAIYLFSHDSIAVGEDGPTHQPIEHLAALRSIPNMSVIRPADERETYAAWTIALQSKNTPTALILSRQGLPLLDGSSSDGVAKGAYIVSKAQKQEQLILIATGSEVTLAIDAQKKLLEQGIDVSVVSMPSWDLFEKQDDEYKQSVLTLPRRKCVSVEMLSSFGWDRYAKHHLSIDSFGASAPAKDVINHFGFTSDALVDKCKEILK